MSQKLIDLSREFLEPGEDVLVTVVGQYEKPKPGGQKEHIRACLLLATDRRILFYAKKVTGHDVESFPYPLVMTFSTLTNPYRSGLTAARLHFLH